MKTEHPTTDELLHNLTGEQALEIVRRLAEKKGAVAQAVAATAREMLAAVEIEEIADDVFVSLDCVDVEACWDMAGASRYGYTSPDEAALQLIEEGLQPFFDQVDRYHDLGMADQERDYCMAVLLGAYRYEEESESEFKDWCEDMPLECAGHLLDTWRRRTTHQKSRAAMNRFIRQHCPKWAKYLTRKSSD